MRQSHPAGERLFVGYAKAEVIDGARGEIRRAQFFVAVLGASNFTKCCRTRNVQLAPSYWFGGSVPRLAVNASRQLHSLAPPSMGGTHTGDGANLQSGSHLFLLAQFSTRSHQRGMLRHQPGAAHD